jgi:hypothetical protein
VLSPLRHELAPLFEHVGSALGFLGLVVQGVRQRNLDEVAQESLNDPGRRGSPVGRQSAIDVFGRQQPHSLALHSYQGASGISLIMTLNCRRRFQASFIPAVPSISANSCPISRWAKAALQALSEATTNYSPTANRGADHVSVPSALRRDRICSEAIRVSRHRYGRHPAA